MICLHAPIPGLSTLVFLISSFHQFRPNHIPFHVIPPNYLILLLFPLSYPPTPPHPRHLHPIPLPPHFRKTGQSFSRKVQKVPIHSNQLGHRSQILCKKIYGLRGGGGGEVEGKSTRELTGKWRERVQDN
jgi:hypothetical protein